MNISDTNVGLVGSEPIRTSKPLCRRSSPVPVLLLARALGPGGTGLQLVGMAKHLDRSRFEPHVCTFWTDWYDAGEIGSLGLPILHLPVRSFKSWSTIGYARQLFHYIRKHRIAYTARSLRSQT